MGTPLSQPAKHPPPPIPKELLTVNATTSFVTLLLQLISNFLRDTTRFGVDYNKALVRNRSAVAK